MPKGQPFAFEILLNGPSFERVALPYVQTLQRLGMEPRVRTIDPAQYQVRIDAFDYDMTVEGQGQSLSPGNEQRDFWTCAKAQEHGSQNIAGIATRWSTSWSSWSSPPPTAPSWSPAPGRWTACCSVA